MEDLKAKIEALKAHLTWAQAEALDGILAELQALEAAVSDLSVIVAELVTAKGR